MGKTKNKYMSNKIKNAQRNHMEAKLIEIT